MIKIFILTMICCCFCLSNSLFANDTIQSKHTKKVETSFVVSGLTPKEIVEKVIKEVKKPYKVKKSDAVAGTLLLSKGASMTSWGEDYPIIVKKISDKACRVEVEFKRKYALQATGKGQHKKCIEYLKGILLK